MPKAYFAYLPVVEGSLEEEFKLCLAQISNTCSAGFSPLKLNVFADVPDYQSLLRARNFVRSSLINTFSSGCPTFNVTAQPPEKPWKVAVEATFISQGPDKVIFRKHLDLPYVVIESEAGKELWAAGISGYKYPDDTRKAAEKAFDLMNDILLS